MSDRIRFGVWVKRISISSVIFLSSGLLSATSCGVFNSSDGFNKGFSGTMFGIFVYFVLASGATTCLFIDDYMDHRVQKND